MNIRDYVEGLDLRDGQRHRGKCPVCYRPNTFTATKSIGKLLWNCYANSCEVSGKFTVNMTTEEVKKRMKELLIDPTNKNDINISRKGESVLPEWVIKPTADHDHAQCITKYCKIYGIDPIGLDLYFDVKEKRVVFPIFFGSIMVDAIGRTMDKRILPKWRRYSDVAQGFERGESSIAVVVEDCTSAAVVETLGLTGVAILGTNLNTSHIFSLQKFKKVIVALDPDAAEKTIRYTKELRANGVDTFALKLLDDIKYRREEDVVYLQKLKREFDGTTNIKESTG